MSWRWRVRVVREYSGIVEVELYQRFHVHTITIAKLSPALTDDFDTKVMQAVSDARQRAISLNAAVTSAKRRLPA